jgi:hypothetical protein
MSRRDFEGRSVRINAACLHAALRWLLQGACWPGIAFRADCTWTPRTLAAAALLWAWSDELTLVDRFSAARRIIARLLPGQPQLAGSYQAFIKLLARWHAPLLAQVHACLRQRLQLELAARWMVEGLIMFGVDGSRLELPRTRSHEDAYAARRSRGKRRGDAHYKKSNSPQLWITTWRCPL